MENKSLPNLPFTIYHLQLTSIVEISLKITEISGKTWELKLLPGATYSIGRSNDNQIILNDQRVSRHHAQIRGFGGNFKIIDGYFLGEELRRSVNKVFVNGSPFFEKFLEIGDVIAIGGSKLEFFQVQAQEINTDTLNEEVLEVTKPTPEKVNYDDQPLGHTQLLISASEIIGKRSNISIETNFPTPQEIKELRRKAQILELLYEMSKTLGTVFDLKEIFVKATDLIFRGTPAERVVALIADESVDGKIIEYSLRPIAFKARDANLESFTEKLTISRTITQKVDRKSVV